MQKRMLVAGMLIIAAPSVARATPAAAPASAVSEADPVPPAAAQRDGDSTELDELQGPFLQVETHLSVLSDAMERSMLAGSFGFGMRGGYRHRGWGVFLHLEHNLWLETDREVEMSAGAVNAAIGVEVSYASGFVRTSLAVGPSILAHETAFDDRGSTGLYVDARPVGLRFPLHEGVALGVDPLSLAVVAPVLDAIPLVNVQYRSTAQLEVSW